MQFDYSTTLILFGRSPYINEIKEDIPTLISKWHTMGCNYFCETFPQVEYCVFNDEISPKVAPSTTIVSNVEYYKDPRRHNNLLCRQHPKKQLYVINKSRDMYEGFAKSKHKLNFYLHTPSIALNWAWKNEFKTVILAGIDLNINAMQHFDANSTPDRDACNFKEYTCINARKYLTEVCTKYLDIYQLNPNSDIELPKVNIKDLL